MSSPETSTESTAAQDTGAGTPDDVLAGIDWVPLPDVADRWGVPVSRVRQLVREGALLAVRSEGVLRVPGDVVGDEGPVKGLPGVLTLLADAGYDDDETLRWLYTPDDTLPGTPVQALVENRGTEVKRRAQAAGF